MVRFFVLWSFLNKDLSPQGEDHCKAEGRLTGDKVGKAVERHAGCFQGHQRNDLTEPISFGWGIGFGSHTKGILEAQRGGRPMQTISKRYD